MKVEDKINFIKEKIHIYILGADTRIYDTPVQNCYTYGTIISDRR